MIWTPGIPEIFATHATVYDHIPAIRDMGLLQSAVERPHATTFGQDAYPTIHDKAAALMDSLCRSRALVDGNKRCAWIAVRLTYYRNHRHYWRSGDDAAYALVLRASDQHLDIAALADQLRQGFSPNA